MFYTRLYKATWLHFFSFELLMKFVPTKFCNVQVEYKHMTPSAALEYVRSIRPRVLLAPSQWKVSNNSLSIFSESQSKELLKCAWSSVISFYISVVRAHWCDVNNQAVQQYKQMRLASIAPQSPSADAVLITKADLEGYHSSCDAGKELAIVTRSTRTRPMIAKLSCLFASLKVSGNCAPVARQLTEARAC